MVAFVMVLWCIFIVNLIRVVGYIGLGNFLFHSNILFLRVLMDPNGTSESFRNATHKTIRAAGWTVISGVILFLIYF